MIKVENLVKRYGQNFALNGVSFEIGEGEIVGLLGPNGAGKSTAMNIITGYLAATSGSVSVDGADIAESPAAVKKTVGYLPEQPPLYPEMTVEEYLNFVYDLKGCTLPREKHIEEVLAAPRLTDVRRRLIGNLSKGYRQRVGIAEALIGDPKILIFDEPTVGLDPKQILEVRNLLRTLAKKHTVILSTHILAEVQAVCERVIIIHRGDLIADCRVSELGREVTGGQHFRIKVAASERDALSAFRAQSGIRSAELSGERESGTASLFIEGERGLDIRKSVFSLCVAKNMPIYELTAVGGDLESVFIRLVDDAEKSRPQRKA